MDVRKKLNELIALYSFESDLKDIYVEGVNDKKLIEWVLSAHNIKDIRVYLIDGVEVNDDILKRHGLNKGSNRSKVLALSAELAQSSLPVTCKIVCISDRDQEDYIPSGLNNCLLEFTDYNSTERYLLRSSVIRKFISLVLGGFLLSEHRLVTQAIPILEDLYVLRLAGQVLNWNMEWIKFKKYVQIAEEFSFDREGFQKAYLLKNGKWYRRAVFEAKVEELRSMLKDDLRLRLRGHDLMELLYYAVKKLKSSRKFGDVHTFRGAFMGCLELSELSGERLFQRILAL